jgi:hypothetical protein
MIEEALDLLEEVWRYQYGFDIHDKIRDFLIKHNRLTEADYL